MPTSSELRPIPSRPGANREGTGGDVVIRVEHLSKRYVLGQPGGRHVTFREMLGQRVRAATGAALAMIGARRATSTASDPDEFWALQDVSFDVRRGEVVGIIGLNGAGKSTLLKILSRVTEPTAGRVTLRGRVASLLEVGTGFHPELTGRENIYLNGAILGMPRAEIDRKFDAIVDFAEVARFLDTPVKRYSSGMYVRLAFAVAAHLEPEILIIDEVLAVGDVVFQKKCLGKMQSVADSGRTVLFVSHNMQTITGLTQRAVLLREGRVAAVGPSAQVVDDYLGTVTTGEPVYERPPTGERPEITRVRLVTSGPGLVQQFGKPMSVEIELSTPEPVARANVSFQILAAGGQPVAHVLNNDAEVPMLRKAGRHGLICRLPHVRLFPGHYCLSFSLGASEPRRTFPAPAQICHFEVAVLDQIRDFYWEPGSAVYVEDVVWSNEAGTLHRFPQFGKPVAVPAEQPAPTASPAAQIVINS